MTVAMAWEKSKRDAGVSVMQLNEPLAERDEAKTEVRLRWWTKASVAVAVLVTVLLSLLSLHSARQATETANWVSHTHEVMTLLERTLRHSIDVETGGRGFAETGSVSFLEPYESGRQAIVQDLHALNLLRMTPVQARHLSILEEQANDQVEAVERIVATRRSAGKTPTIELFTRGKQLMDAVRITVEQMEESERGLLASQTQRAHTAQHVSTTVIALGSLLGVIFLIIAGMRVNREINVSAMARCQVKEANASLERRVE
jgi:CHASE3 domain sensor protein